MSEYEVVETKSFQTFRKADTGNMELLFASLLNASNPAEYQKITLTIQHKLRENGLDKNNATNCFHPMWFGVNEDLLVDDTICRFCGYKFSCEKFKQSKNDSVEIIFLDNSMIPKNIVESSFVGYDITGNKKKQDPFMGFSNLAGSARKLYAISLKNFKKYSPNKSIETKIETTIGYDSKFGQPLWIFDQLMLNELHRGNLISDLKNSVKRLKFSRIKTKLYEYDKLRLKKYAIKAGWCMKNSNEREFEAVELIIQRFCDLLVRKSKRLRELTSIPFTPGIDYPENNGCSGLVNLVIRFLHFNSDILLDYINAPKRLNDDLLAYQEKVVSRMVFETLFSFDSQKEGKNNPRFIPRFPIVAFSSINSCADLDFEYPAGRVINLIQADLDEPIFLIDSLGHELEVKGLWSQC